MTSVLDSRGIKQDIVITPEADFAALDPLAADLLIIMGGSMGVYEAADYPFITSEIEYVRRRLAAGLPVLGICLGAQIMAAALGSEVYKGLNGQEIGWHDITVSDEGQKHAVRHLDKATTCMMHWHGDTFDLPDRARLLASSQKYTNQIFSYGKNALAIQSHPEVRAEQLEKWYESFADDLDNETRGLDESRIRADTEKYLTTLNRQTELFFNEWLDSIGL